MGICFVGQKRKFSEFLGKGIYLTAVFTPLSLYVHTTRFFSQLSGTKSRPNL